MAEQEVDIVVSKSGRVAGCRGRVLVALIVLAILLLLLAAMLVRDMVSGTAPQPVHGAAAEAGPRQDAALPERGRPA